MNAELASEIAAAAFFAQQGSWERGGDLCAPDGFLFRRSGVLYAVKLELWMDACLMDLAKPSASAARRRGVGLAKRWSKAHWPFTGYQPVDHPAIYGYTWAVDLASEDEAAAAREDDIIDR